MDPVNNETSVFPQFKHMIKPKITKLIVRNTFGAIVITDCMLSPCIQYINGLSHNLICFDHKWSLTADSASILPYIPLFYNSNC